MMTSYAQNREDVRLARVFPDADGFFIDVGRSGPPWHSVTRHFAERGWSGLETTARTSADAPTLAALCEAQAVTSIDFLVVARDGDAGAVLAGHDWTRWRPRVVVVEAIDTAAAASSTHASWEPILIEAQYRPAAFDGVNRFYVREEDAHLAERLVVPVSTRDQYRPYEHQLVPFAGADAPVDAAARLIVEAADAQLAAVWAEVDHLRLQLRRLQAQSAAGERRLAGLRNVARGLAMLLTPAPVAVEDPSLPTGVRGRVLRLGRGLRPIARRFPRLAQAARRWVYRART